MPRSNWKGVISFGLVTIPIVLYPSRNNKADITFHQIDKKDNARIKYQRVNANTGKVVPWENITKGYEYDKDQMIPVPDEVLKRVAGEDARTVDIKNFVDKDELDLIFVENTYYVVPDKKGEKGYVILREALSASNKIAIAKVIISTKEYLAALMPHDKALILCLLRYASEINSLADYDIPTKEPASLKVNKKEIDVAKQLIKSMTVKWKPEKYTDEYQAAIHQWAEEAVHHLPHKATKKKSVVATDNVNFIDLLRKSLKSGQKTKAKAADSSAHYRATKSKSRSGRHATKH